LKIVILDSWPANAHDLDWSPLAELGELKVYDSTAKEQIVERAKGAEIVLTNKVPITSETVAQLPDLKMVQVLATGYNVIDTAATKAAGIRVCNVPAYSTPSVAQHAISLLLALTNRVELHSDSVHAGEWTSGGVWSYWKSPLVELEGKVFGVVGFGAIGKRVAHLADALGMKVIVAKREGRECPYDQLPLEELLEVADVVSLHCPLTPETQHLINSNRLSRMKSTSILLNTGRGPLIDEHALASALKEGKIGGAGLDVLSQEPPSADNPLIVAPNCVITPHVAWASFAARKRMIEVILGNVTAYVNGNPVNVVA
jgi:glycerate dehydrogenase